MPIVDAAILRQLAPRYNGARAARQHSNITRAAPFFPASMAHYRIDTMLRQAHFLAQVCEESWGFSDMKEEDSGARYEGSKTLGNTVPGYGVRYKGRGFLQLTGRYNYGVYGHELHLDLLHHPELAETPEVAVRSACAFWKKHHLNRFADLDDIVSITRKINGPGMRGLAARKAFLKHAKLLLAEAWIDHAMNDLGDECYHLLGKLVQVVNA